MRESAAIAMVSTIQERCRTCYMCVRECPAKAIRISSGRVEVLPERCIGCGDCIRVCNQRAKRIYDSVPEVNRLLASGEPVAAILASSFPAEFTCAKTEQLVGMVRALGFSSVHEASFGGDLVAERYRRLLTDSGDQRYIAANCPAIVSYVQRYAPDLTTSLAPIVSPMVAMGRALKALYGEDLRIVFIGPCIAKKAEIRSPQLRHEVDGALTFRELRRMFQDREITLDTSTPTALDPPFGRAGGLYPISRGLLQAANITEDLTRGEVVAADGRSQYPEAIEEFEAGRLNVRLLEVLACRGCINGPGISYGTSVFARQMAVSKHVRERLEEVDEGEWRENMQRFATLDLSRGYEADDQRLPVPSEDELRGLLKRIGKNQSSDELNCGACGYDTCRELAIATYKGLAESAMCLPWTIEELRKTMRELAVSNDRLDETREALLHSERLATMGQLAAGIAHELNNPLGIILMYAHLLKDEYECAGQLQEDLSMITEQSDRCKKIVAGLLDFARQNKVEREVTDVAQLVDRAFTASPAPPDVEVDVRYETKQRTASIDRDQMLQVLINLLENAYAAMPGGGCVTVAIAALSDRLRLTVSDTGTGIPADSRDKIFEPFFTTREAGQGTGLGLAVSYGIVKMHRGDISVVSNTDPEAGPTGTAFTIVLPQTADCS